MVLEIAFILCTECKNAKKGRCALFNAPLQSELLKHKKRMFELNNRACFEQRKKSKYKNTRVKIDGYGFDSKAEGERYRLLIDRWKSGEIANLKIHPVFMLQEAFEKDRVVYSALTYEADFQYWDVARKEIVIEDVKGLATDVYLIKKKLFEKKYPLLKITEIKIRN
jgi:hypothetical protein